MKKALCLQMIAGWTAAPQCFHPEIDTYADHMSDILQRIEKINDEWYTERIFWSSQIQTVIYSKRWTHSFPHNVDVRKQMGTAEGLQTNQCGGKQKATHRKTPGWITIQKAWGHCGSCCSSGLLTPTFDSLNLMNDTPGKKTKTRRFL